MAPMSSSFWQPAPAPRDGDVEDLVLRGRTTANDAAVGPLTRRRGAPSHGLVFPPRSAAGADHAFLQVVKEWPNRPPQTEIPRRTAYGAVVRQRQQSRPPRTVPLQRRHDGAGTQHPREQGGARRADWLLRASGLAPLSRDQGRWSKNFPTPWYHRPSDPAQARPSSNGGAFDRRQAFGMESVPSSPRSTRHCPFTRCRPVHGLIHHASAN